MAGINGFSHIARRGEVDGPKLTLFQKLCRTEAKNFVISPTSLATLLALLSAGLEGECRRELRKFLAGGIDLPEEDPEQDEIFHKVCNIKLANHQPWKMGFKLLVDKDCEVRKEAEVLLKVSVSLPPVLIVLDLKIANIQQY